MQVCVKPGQVIAAGQVLAVMSAMKMETTVGAPCDGVVSHVAVIKNDILEAGDLMVRITPGQSEGTESTGEESEDAANGTRPESSDTSAATA
jgi:pyruvate/2-oxoglutarate dehydrogenase complex dihydrolipoamide acyltransferase (E2) component